MTQQLQSKRTFSSQFLLKLKNLSHCLPLEMFFVCAHTQCCSGLSAISQITPGGTQETKGSGIEPLSAEFKANNLCIVLLLWSMEIIFLPV